MFLSVFILSSLIFLFLFPPCVLIFNWIETVHIICVLCNLIEFEWHANVKKKHLTKYEFEKNTFSSNKIKKIKPKRDFGLPLKSISKTLLNVKITNEQTQKKTLKSIKLNVNVLMWWFAVHVMAKPMKNRQ